MNTKQLTRAAMAIVVIIVVSTLIVLYQQQKRDLAKQRQENELLRLQAEQATADMKQLPPKETSIAKATPANPSTKHFMEVLRLRGEVGRLRQQLFDHTNRVTQRTHDEELVLWTRQSCQTYMSVLLENAQQNNGRLAERFEQPDTNALQYIVLYSGLLQDIETPTNVFVLQQVTPVRLSNGNWIKSYGRADGSIVLHEEADGNFQRWENENGIRKVVTTAFPMRTP